MKRHLIPLLLILTILLTLFTGCTVDVSSQDDAEQEASSRSYEPDCVITFEGASVSISGSGAGLDDGQVLITQAGVYQISGICDNSRIMVKAGDTDDVTILLAGLTLTNPEDEAIYFKTAGSATVILLEGTENTLTGGIEPESSEETAESTDTEDRAEEDTATGAALRAICSMTIGGEGSLTVNGYINNGIAADGGLVITGGTLDVTAVNNGLKSDGDVSIAGGSITVYAQCDGVQAGSTLDITGGELNVTTGAGAEGADMKVSDSLMMGGGGMGGGRNDRSSAEASAEASSEAGTDETTESNTDALTMVPANSASAEAESAENADAASKTEADSSSSGEMFASREMQSGMMPGMEMNWDADDAGEASRKGLKAAEAINISGGTITVDAEDDAIHSDGSIAISGGEMTLSSGDDGMHGETTLNISDGHIVILYCYEGLEATGIYILGGYMNITATDDGMNAGGMGMGMMGFGGMGRGSSGEASQETSEETEAIETEDTSSQEAEETVETVVRITGGIVIVNSGGDGLDSNASMYIEGGTIFVSGPSSDWDSPIDFGEGSSEFIISGGTLMAAGYSGMFESPDSTDASQASIYYVQSGYALDNAVTVLKKADGTVLAEYAFANSYNGILISTPDMAAGETYTLTIDGVDTTIEMTAAQYSNRGGSGEMGGPGGMGGRGR